MENVTENQQVKKRISKGKQKIEIKKIEKKSARQVTFNKRRNGLVKKCCQMSAEFGSDFAVVTFSEAGNPFVSGSPSADAVIKRYLDDSRSNVAVGSEPRKACLGSNDKWWDNPIDDMSLDELERFETALKSLRKDVATRLERTSRVNGNMNVGSYNSNRVAGARVDQTNCVNDTQIINFGGKNSNLGVQKPAEVIHFRCADARNNGVHVTVHLSDFSTQNVNVGNTNSNLGVPEASSDEVNEVHVSQLDQSNGSNDTKIIDFRRTDARKNGVYLSELCSVNINVGNTNPKIGTPKAFNCAQFKANEVNEAVVSKVEPSNDTKINEAIDDINLSDFLSEIIQTTNVVNWDNRVQETCERFDFGCTDASDGIHLSDLCNETKSVDVGSNNSSLSVQESTEKLDLGVIEGSIGGKAPDYYEWMDNTVPEIYPELLTVDGCSFMDLLTGS